VNSPLQLLDVLNEGHAEEVGDFSGAVVAVFFVEAHGTVERLSRVEGDAGATRGEQVFFDAVQQSPGDAAAVVFRRDGHSAEVAFRGRDRSAAYCSNDLALRVDGNYHGHGCEALEKRVRRHHSIEPGLRSVLRAVGFEGGAETLQDGGGVFGSCGADCDFVRRRGHRFRGVRFLHGSFRAEFVTRTESGRSRSQYKIQNGVRGTSGREECFPIWMSPKRGDSFLMKRGKGGGDAGSDSETIWEPDEVRTFEKGRFELVRLGGMTIGRATYEPGWKWSEHVGRAVGAKSCSVEHVGMVVSGRATAAMDDGRVIEMKAGDLFYIAPGHDSWVVGDEPYVSIHLMGADAYAKAKKE
jgi:hypothetical protein